MDRAVVAIVALIVGVVIGAPGALSPRHSLAGEQITPGTEAQAELLKQQARNEKAMADLNELKLKAESAPVPNFTDMMK